MNYDDSVTAAVSDCHFDGQTVSSGDGGGGGLKA